jgi:hypothetical protein
MGSETPQTRTLKRALEIAGSPDLLAKMLACDTASLVSWLSGQVPTPSEMYLRALDVVSGRRPAPGKRRP